MITNKKPGDRYEVIVVGGGHAGCEASLAAARMGASTLLLTINRHDIARMPCNPAIGGLAKGQLVREIDALGGEMALCIDKAGIQFRMLNRAKGPAVWSPRAQADKKLYHERMMEAIEGEGTLDLAEGEVTALIVDSGVVKGVEVDGGGAIYGQVVILALGTFPNGLMHIGEKKIPGGREGEPPSNLLSDQLESLGLERKRLKTGTPARLRKGSIDFSRCELQPGDEVPSPFSFRTDKIEIEQVPCHITATNRRTHEIIRRNVHRAPLFTGQIRGLGPRYCPSIEDKVFRFAERERHQVFLEPEGRESEEIYVNGMSTSLPADVQLEMIKTVPGLEDAEIVRYGYAIEYDFFPPWQVTPALRSRRLEGLYFAGQVNGTSGYEEAAAQGIMTGINAALELRRERPLLLGRHEAYIGVMIDDLVTKDIDEPYRMFTSRAEHRLMLRQDNADERLMKYGARLKLIDRALWEKTVERRKNVERARRRMSSEIVPQELCRSIPGAGGPDGMGIARTGLKLSLLPGIGLDDIEGLLPGGRLHLSVREMEMLSIRIKYDGYIRRQKKIAEKLMRMDRISIPEEFSYDIQALSTEAREKLKKFRPETLGQASRISGVRISDLSILMVFIDRLGEERTEPGRDGRKDGKAAGWGVRNEERRDP